MARNGPGLSVAFELTRRPDIRGMARAIVEARERIHRQAADRLVRQLIPEVIRSQGASVGTEWGNRTKYAGGAPALLSLVGRFRTRIGAEDFFVTLSHPHGRVLQYGGRLRSKGKLFALPFPGVTGKPGDYRDTFIRPAKKVPGAFVVFQRTGRGPKDVRPLFFETPQVVLPRRLFLTWFEEYRSAVREECERAVDEIVSRVGTREV